MTAPVLDVQQHADDLSDRIRALVALEGPKVSGALASRLDLLLPDLVRMWVRFYGGSDRGPRPGRGEAADFAERAAAKVRAALNPIAVRQGVLDEAWLTAYGMGTDHAIDTAPVVPLSLPERDQADTPDLGAVVVETLAHALTALSEESVEAHGFASVGVAVARARTAVRRIDTITAYELTRAATEGVLDVAKDQGTQVMWVAERNGCLHCLAYSGATTNPSGTPSKGFPEGLTFADRPLNPPTPFVGPPLHPRCRCTLELFDPRDQAIADGLKREARRSVLRGWAHESESGPAKVRAADRLLMTASGQDMPKSVKAVARKAVDQGGFPDDNTPNLPARRNVTVVPDPDDPNTPAVVLPADMDNETLDRAVQSAIEDLDYDRLDELTAELDRRDDGSWAKAWAPSWAGFEERTGIAVEQAPVTDQRLAVMADLVRQGVDEADAYAEAYGVSGERFARDQAIAGLRALDYKGEGFEQLARQSYRDYVARQFRLAEDDTNGYLLTPEAEAAGVSAIELFSGPLPRALKWASEELLDWWEVNGRMTFDEHKAALLGRTR